VNWPLGLLGLVGVIFVGLGIEGMNEYFDLKLGGDRVFSSARRVRVWWHLPLGLSGFAAAATAVSLTVLRCWPVAVFALCGEAIALSYLMPPVRLSHRGLGEAVIALAYGPGPTLGGFYLQTGVLSYQAGVVSLLPGLAMFAMALANEVPDYYGDRLVDKRNLIVRMGPRRDVMLAGAVMGLWFALLCCALVTGVFPPLLGLCLLLIPVTWRSVRQGLRHYSSPAAYVGVIRMAIIFFTISNTIAVVGYILR